MRGETRVTTGRALKATLMHESLARHDRHGALAPFSWTGSGPNPAAVCCRSQLSLLFSGLFCLVSRTLLLATAARPAIIPGSLCDASQRSLLPPLRARGNLRHGPHQQHRYLDCADIVCSRSGRRQLSHRADTQQHRHEPNHQLCRPDTQHPPHA